MPELSNMQAQVSGLLKATPIGTLWPMKTGETGAQGSPRKQALFRYRIF